MEPSASDPANTYSQRLLDSSAEDLFGIGTQAAPRDEEPGFFSSLATGFQQMPAKFIDDYSRTFEDISGYAPGVDEPVDLPQILSPEEMEIGTPGELTRDIGAFLGSFVGGGVVLKLFKGADWLRKATTAQKVFAGALQGIPAEFVHVGKNYQNIADVARDFGLENVLVDYIASGPNVDDNALTKRLKSALTGTMTGAALDVTLRSMVYLAKGAKKKVWEDLADGTNAEVFEAIEEVTGSKVTQTLTEPEVKQFTEALKKGAVGNSGASSPRIKLFWEKEAKNISREIEELAEKSADDITTSELLEKISPTVEAYFKTNSMPLSDATAFISALSRSVAENPKMKILRGDPIEWSKRNDRFVRSWDTTAEKADDAFLALDPRDADLVTLTKALHETTDNIDVKLYLTRSFFFAESEKMSKTVDEVLEMFNNKSVRESMSENDMLALKAKFIGQMNKFMTAKGFLTGAQSNLARGLRSLAVPIKNEGFYDPANITKEMVRRMKQGDIELEQIQEMANHFGDAGLKKAALRLKKTFKNEAKTKSKDALKSKIDAIESTGLMDMMLRYRIINMLSGLGTLTWNTVGSSLMTLNRQLLNPATAAAWSAFKRNILRSNRDEPYVSIGEVVVRFSAMAGTTLENASKTLSFLARMDWNIKKFTRGETGFKRFMQDMSFDPDTRIAGEGFKETVLPSEFLKQKPIVPDLADSTLTGRTLQNIAYKTQSTISSVAEKSLARIVTAPLDFLWQVGDTLSLGTMQYTDMIFKNANAMAELRATAYRKSLGMGTNQRAKFVEEYMDQVQKYLKSGKFDHLRDQYKMPMKKVYSKANEILEDVATAKKVAKDAVLQGELGKTSEKFARFLAQDQAMSKFARLLIPFYRTPMNFFKFVGQHTPGLHRLSKEMREALSGAKGQVAKDEAEAKLIIGSTMLMSAVALAQSGYINGRFRKDRREALLAAGMLEYSFKLKIKGETRFVRFNRLDPFAIQFGVVADLVSAGQEMSEGDYEKAMSLLLLGFVDQTANKTWMKTVGETLQAFMGRPGGIPKVLTNIARPSLAIAPSAAYRTINTLMAKDKEFGYAFQEARTMQDKFYADTPGLGPRFNKLRVDALGNPQGAGNTFTDALFKASGLSISRLSEWKSLRQLAELNALMLKRDVDIEGVRLTDNEAYEFRRILREDVNIMKYLEDFVNNPGYEDLSPLARYNGLKRIQRVGRNLARKQLLGSNPELLEKVQDRLIQLAQLKSQRGLPTVGITDSEAVERIMQSDIEALKPDVN